MRNFLKEFILIVGMLLIGIVIQAQCIVINELMINAAGGNDGANSPNTSEWVELYNTCSTPVDIGCYALSDGDFTVVIPSGTILQPYSHYTLGSTNSGFVPNLNWGTCGCTTQVNPDEVGIFTNGNEQLILKSNTGTLVDAIVWGNGQFPVNNTSASVGGCVAQSFNYPSSTAAFENIGTGGADGCAKARSCDGSMTWVELCGLAITPGTSNNGETPQLSISASSVDICEGSCIDFSYTGNGSPTSYAWTFEGSSTTSSSLASPQNICYSTAGDYDVEVEITNSCGTFSLVMDDYVHVSSTADVQIMANGSTVICSGGSVVLETTSSGPFQWKLNGTAISGATSQSYSATQAGTYSLTTTGDCGGVSNDIEVTLQALLQPTISAGGSVNICNSESVVLSVDGSYSTYQWYQGATLISGATSSTYSATQSGSYHVEVTQQGCDGTSNAIVVTHTSITSPILMPVSSCQGESVNLNVSGGYDSYQWQSNGNPVIGQTSSSYTFTVSQSFSISVTVTSGTCEATSNVVTVTSISAPQVSIQPSASVEVCQDSFVLTGTSDAGNYQWFFNGNPISGATSNTYTATQSGLYRFSSTSETGNCTTTSQVVSVSLDVVVDVSISASDLNPCGGQTVTLSVQGNFTNIVWSNNATSSSIQVTSSGVYTVSVTAGTCVATDELTLVFQPKPIANAGLDTISDCDQGVMLSGSGTGDLSWLPHSDLITTPGTAIAYANPNKTTYFTLTATIGSCVATDEVKVEVDCSSLYIPNVFTPNNDGINDFFEIEVRGVSQYHLRVFNRWGELLFESTEPTKVWNGGKEDYYAPDGIYFWILETLDYQGKPLLGEAHRQGHVTLVR